MYREIPRSRRRRRAGLLLLASPGILVTLLALAGPLAVSASDATSRGRPFQNPGTGSPLGTDHLGRDVWSVLLDSGTALILVPLAATVLSTAIGAGLGLLTGWHRSGRISGITVRASELMLVIPPLLVAVLALNAVSGTGVAATVVVIALLSVPATLRFTRSATSSVLSRGYIEHAVALGERTPVLLTREVLPTIAAPVLADAGNRLVGAIYLLASVSFLGVGGSALEATWAGMVAENIAGASLNPLAVVAPAACIVALAVSVNLVADRLADGLRRSI